MNIMSKLDMKVEKSKVSIYMLRTQMVASFSNATLYILGYFIHSVLINPIAFKFNEAIGVLETFSMCYVKNWIIYLGTKTNWKWAPFALPITQG